MLKAFIRWPDGKISRETDADTIRRALEQKAIFWLDMQNPDDQEVKLLSDVFHFHPLAIEDASKAHQQPKVEQYGARSLSSLGPHRWSKAMSRSNAARCFQDN